MTVPFYSQAELDAAIIRERRWIAERMCVVAAEIECRCLDSDNAGDIRDLAGDVANGIYPRPLVVASEVPNGG